MGFGTGHHATTRLCLAALQRLPLHGRTVLDVGTGSGVLALAARLLGARDAVGLDVDPDAIQSAEENLAANPAIDRVLFVTGDLRTVPLDPADVVTANLTGALLVQTAGLLRAAVRPGGTLIVSGLLDHERSAVVEALSPAAVVWEESEQNWVGLALNISGVRTV
jgi:ribosomal protein L11 methyltransferase